MADRAIVIDNGSYECRAGWSHSPLPQLRFRSLAAKGKKDGDTSVVVGLDFKDADVARLAARSPFESNVVYHFETQEFIFDEVFSGLGITSSCVPHPVVITEAPCNLNYSRKMMSELMFECYGVPSVCYGVGALFSYYYNHPRPKNVDSCNGLVVESSYQTSHIIPILHGETVASKAKRINVGGYDSTDLLLKVTQLKYPFLRTAVSTSFAQQMKEERCYVAKDYLEELGRWRWDVEYGNHSTHTIQLPFMPPPAQAPLSEEEKNRKQQIKQDQAKRLAEISMKRKAEKNEEKQRNLAQLQSIRSLKDIHEADFKDQLARQGMTSLAQLDKAIAGVKASLNPTPRKKAAKNEAAPAATTPTQPKPEKEDHPLLSIPDSELTPEQIKEKNKHKALKAAKLAKQKAKAKRDEIKIKKEQEKKVEDEKRLQNPDQWLADLHARKQAILDAKDRRKLSGTMGRRADVSTKRMKLMAKAIHDENPNKADTFGESDDDWNLYIQMSTDVDSEEENAQISEIDALLRKHDPAFANPTPKLAPTPQDFQIHLDVDRVRIPELVFEPTIIGLDQMGLSECINQSLLQFTPPQRPLLVQNVFLTGGNTKFPGMQERVSYDIAAMLPTGTPIRVTCAKDPSLDAWRGAAAFCGSSAWPSCLITKKLYDECGHHYLQTHYASNPYIPPPAPLE